MNVLDKANVAYEMPRLRKDMRTSDLVDKIILLISIFNRIHLDEVKLAHATPGTAEMLRNRHYLLMTLSLLIYELSFRENEDGVDLKSCRLMIGEAFDLLTRSKRTLPTSLIETWLIENQIGDLLNVKELTNIIGKAVAYARHCRNEHSLRNVWDDYGDPMS